MRLGGLQFAASTALTAISLAAPAAAQSDGKPTATPDEETIVVTARKKAERDLEVPAAMSVLRKRDLERLAITSVTDISSVTPGLRLSPTVAIFGGVGSLRGVGASTSDFLADQALAFTLDGVTLTKGQGVQFGLFDLERVEVLKGPQSLYYGKNTTAGIISVVAADPTPEFMAMVRVGYEFEGRGKLVEGVISGPIADGLSARLALYHYGQNGLFRVPDASGVVGYFGPIGPRTSPRVDHSNSNAARFSILAEPTEGLTISLKLSAFQKRGNSPYMLMQVFGCPLGTPNPSSPAVLPLPEFQDCKVDGTVPSEAVENSSTLAQFPELSVLQDSGGRHRFGSDQYLAVSKISYDVSDAIQLESVTSYYDLSQEDIGPGVPGAQNLIPLMSSIDDWDLTQELRVSSSFNSALNFMAGAFYQKGEYQIQADVLFPNFFASPLLPPGQFRAPAAYMHQTSETESVFGQITYDFADDFQILVGGRYIKETKGLVVTSGATGELLSNPIPSIDFESFTPEITLTWRPDPNINVFLSYREGLKSGGYSISNYATVINPDDFYGNETAAGVEAGIKSVLFDNQLRADVSVYRYEYDDLQLGFFNTETLFVRTVNVGSAKSYGAELTMVYRPAEVDGLTLTGSINYNHLRYGNGAVGACYAGQSIAQDCSLSPFGGVFTAQDLDGRRPTRSADWTGSASLAYEHSLAGNLLIAGSVSANFSSKYNPVAELTPPAQQSGYTTIDAELRVFTDDESWEIAVVGKNLTNEIRIQSGYGLPFTPAANLAGTEEGGQYGDSYGTANDPRTIQARLTYRY